MHCPPQEIVLSFGNKVFEDRRLIHEIAAAIPHECPIRVDVRKQTKNDSFVLLEHEAYPLDENDVVEEVIRALTPRSSPGTARISLVFNGSPLKSGERIPPARQDYVNAETEVIPTPRFSESHRPPFRVNAGMSDQDSGRRKPVSADPRSASGDGEMARGPDRDTELSLNGEMLPFAKEEEEEEEPEPLAREDEDS
jgi:hypothetical protein